MAGAKSRRFASSRRNPGLGVRVQGRGSDISKPYGLFIVIGVWGKKLLDKAWELVITCPPKFREDLDSSAATMQGKLSPCDFIIRRLAKWERVLLTSPGATSQRGGGR